MKIKLILVFSVVAAASSHADVGEGTSVLTTLSGKTYRAVRIAEVTPDGVYFRHADGAGKVLFADLPAEVRESLGFDAKKAEGYRKELAERQSKERLAIIERDKEAAKAQASACAASASYANVAAAQLMLASNQAPADNLWGWNSGYPIVWTGGGWGWYDERVPSRSYGGSACYTVRRWIRQPMSYQTPFRAGQVASSVPYSPNHIGGAPFTNGVPALGASFVSQRAGHRAPVTGTSGHGFGCAPGVVPAIASGRSR